MQRLARGHVVPITKRNNYRVYSPSKLSHAYHDVVEKNLSVYKAARIYNVPEQTLRDRINGRIDFETTRSGPSPIFSVEEEVRLVDHIKEIARVGYAYTRAEVVNVASEYAVCLGSRSSEKPLTLKWFYGFLGRWPELKVRRPKTISELRARATSPECIDSYFHELKNILDKYDLSSRPQSIYNVDEKGIQQNFKPPSVVSDVDSMPSVIMSERSATTTILGCGNALGQHIPPYFIFAGARMRQELLEGCTHGADSTVSQSGWSNGEIFKKYLEDHFLKFSTPRSAEKTLLLMYDGHRSHISPDIIDWANEHHIILYVLPPHTSHILQPMDVGCFGPFSKIYNNECLKFQREHGACVSRYNICSIACKAYAAALSPQNLQSSFSRSGIHPYSPGSIDVSHLVISKERRKFVQEQTSNEDQSEIQTEPEPELRDEQLGVEEEKNQEVDQQEGEMEKEDNCESNINQNTNAQTDKTEVTVKFFQKKRPVFVPPFKSQRRSISNIVAGKAITESEVSEKIWGRSKSDLELVKISTKQPTRTNVNGLYNYENISYNNQELDGQQEKSVACRVDYHPTTNLHSHTQEVDVTCLQSLNADVEYLKYLISEQTGKWDLAPSSPENAPSKLSTVLARGFLYGMSDTVGKEAIRKLLQQIISKLGLEQDLDVVHTGSPSNSSFLSTLVEIDTGKEYSSTSPSSGDNPPEVSSTPSPLTVHTLMVPSYAHGTRSWSVESSSASSAPTASAPYPPTKKRKLLTSDVIVYSNIPKIRVTKAITSKLVVSVKSGSENSDNSLPIELMSRLPYQSGTIFGLHINACEGQLFSVSRDRENDSVHIFSYTQHKFKRTDHRFDHEKFFNLILDLGKVLLSDP